MGRFVCFAIRVLLGIGLYIGTGQSAWAIGQQSAQANEHSPISPNTSAFQTSCSVTIQEQAIPDDGTWLQVCLMDPNAPDQSTVTEVQVKYQLEHPDPNQLEIRLTRSGTNASATLWNRGNAIQGAKLGETSKLGAFKGTPSQGVWYLSVRDTVPGQKGHLKSVSVRAFYAPTGPLPQIATGTPSRSTSLRIPPGATQSRTPDADKKKSATRSQGASPLQTTGWQEIRSETFEGTFPARRCGGAIQTECWTLIGATTDPYGVPREYLWDDDDFRPHPHANCPPDCSYWAAWPANGGTDGLDPQYSAYPPNMNSRMIYGPFDLSNARTAESVFWLWRQIEVYYDYVFFGISSDGNTFNGWLWDGTADWEEQRFNLNGYLGDSSVWVAWLFVSDSTVQYEGPWVDDILIRKYVPGQVTAQGIFSYADRNGIHQRARFTKVYLYDWDANGNHDQLGSAIITSNHPSYGDGFFQFPPVTNWDTDDSDPDPNNRRLDLFVEWETDVDDSATARRRVTNFTDRAYRWSSFTSTNAPDGIVDFSTTLPVGWANLGAMWIFQDLRRAWEYIRNNSNPRTDPGSVTARWQAGQNAHGLCNGSCFYAGTGEPYIFIADGDRESPDQVIHEVGHHYMYNATQWWWWNPICALTHNIFVQTDTNCAWSEGWAYFVPLVVNGDPCYDFGRGVCGTNNTPFENLETPTWGDNRPQGHAVEGRVAGALYDLFDNANDGFDQANFGFNPIWWTLSYEPWTFEEFWRAWKARGYNKHRAVRAIYQNTIDYNTTPRFNPLLPDRTVLQNFVLNQAIDLWAHSEDDESADSELTWQIVTVTDSRCGVSLSSNNRYVNLAPQQGWLGSCDVTIRVSDSLRTADDTFRVNVVPVQGRIYLPIILK